MYVCMHACIHACMHVGKWLGRYIMVYHGISHIHVRCLHGLNPTPKDFGLPRSGHCEQPGAKHSDLAAHPKNVGCGY